MSETTTLLHFVLTSMVGHYIAIRIGSSTGQIVAEGLIEATESLKPSEEELKGIHQKMHTKVNEVISRWRIPLLLISLPTEPVIRPLLDKTRKTWMYDPVLSKKIPKDQFKTRAMILRYLVTGLNSLTLGTLIYFSLRLFFRKAAS